MKFTLYEIFHNDLEGLLEHLPSQDISEIRGMDNKSITDKRDIRIRLALKYHHKKLIDDIDLTIVEDPYFFRIMLHYNFEEGVRILKDYRNDPKLAAEYIKQVAIWGGIYDDNMDEFDELLHELEMKHSRIWVIDVLLTINPEDVNEYEDLDYVNSFSVLKYIGNVDQFRDKFTRWFNNYNDSNFDRGMKYEPVLKDYLIEVAKYMPYIPECLSVYKQLKKLKPKNYNNPDIDGLELITTPMYEITG